MHKDGKGFTPLLNHIKGVDADEWETEILQHWW